MIGCCGASKRRVAIVHYWLVGMRGGERVLEALCRMFPQADIFTHVAHPAKLSATLKQHRIQQTWIGQMPFARRLYQSYLPLMPRALEALDLSSYDLVISSEAGPAKGVIAPVDALHLCYCHSPMRYLWDQYPHYHREAGTLKKLGLAWQAHGLRKWDVTSAARVDRIVANSNHVAGRVQKYWRRKADVVAPPVAVERFHPAPAAELEDFYLWAGELAPYKRPDIAVEAFRRLKKPLLVLGGPDSAVRRLRRLAGPKTQFLGRVPFSEMRNHMARCRALIFPGEEDFGIVPVEVMASGRPVIAYGRGGVCDTIVHETTGFLFEDQSVDGLMDAVKRFEKTMVQQVAPTDCLAQARLFSEAVFQRKMRAMIPD